MARFATVSENDLAALDSEKDSKSTKRVLKRSVMLFREFLGEENHFESFSKEQLNGSLRRFFASVRKTDGTELKKSSLMSIRYGLAKYLKDECEIDISNDPVFASAVTTFKGKVSDLKKKGKGAVDHKCEISSEDLNKLRNDNVALNTHTPCGLQKKVWFDIMFYLCRRGQENLREMSKSTFGLGVDATGRRYIHQVEDEADKNHRGASTSDDTIGEGKMYEQPDDPNCPVASYLKYVGKLHPELDSLWQRPLDGFNESSDVWYCKVAVGKNSLAKWMGEISSIAGLSRYYTNHCIRVTSISALDRAGMEARHIMRITGHKSESSIRSYSRRLTDSKQRNISDTLSNAMGPSSTSHADSPNPSDGNMTGLEGITEEELLEVFSDENLFLEVLPQNVMNKPNVTEPNANNLQNTESQNENRPLNPTMPFQPAIVQNPEFLQSGMVNNQLNYIPGAQVINAPFECQTRPYYNINPTMNNCVVNFNFHGK